MGRKPTVDREELRRLAAAGLTNAELAARFGVSESGILQAKRAAGLSRPMLDHGAAIPWKLRREHNQSGPATNLRNLSALAQGAPVPPTKANTALRWARRLTEAGLDITYHPDRGFEEIPAGPESHLARVLKSAEDHLA
ncbi:hypothetical protein [Bailinhaonella thermotolerans]|uniref:Uncharacterized protein n=1 Tax=Bailinhaonella thermotolerans TaxID=1070861 RepID=A0A3A4AEF7_9ACTN|nr:hypothetical protein [Bailinhaonella thermotolerans]RJL24430.1 hypothetical protein D5H75_29285 [Bailinhaonella thermotolerans]